LRGIPISIWQNRIVSWDLAILSNIVPLDADQALSAYWRLCDGEVWSEVLQPDGRIADFVREITARWPDINDVSDDQLDSCPWSIGLSPSPADVILCMRYDRVDVVAPVCVDTALRLGLNVFDPQAGVLHSPGQEPRAITPTPPEERICAECGRPIGQSESFGKHIDSEGWLHIGCLFRPKPGGTPRAGF